MAKQVQVEIELENGKKLTYCMSLAIRQEFGGHHTFEVLVPFEILEDSKDVFFNKSHDAVLGKTAKFSIKPVDSSDNQNFNFKGIVTSIELRNNNLSGPCFAVSGNSADALLLDGKQRRTFVKQSLKQIYNKVLESYPQNLLKRKIRFDDDPTIEYEVQYDESNYNFCRDYKFLFILL